jgi:valyl-tRNA synthetase
LVFLLALANVGFGGIMDPESEDFKYYYPTNDLVTGPDILFFWVARMISRL